jgi:sulfite reductase alpha subunit-like flavoprotein
MIQPQNTIDAVQKVIDYLGLNEQADQWIIVQSNNPLSPINFDKPTTIRHLMIHFMDLFGRPRRSFFELLSHFTQNELHKEKLEEFNTAAGQEDLYTYCHRPRRTAFEILQDFNSVKIPLDYLLDVFPKMRPRAFSIASSPHYHTGEIQLTVGIIEYKTTLKSVRQGICTKWMKEWQVGGND